MPHPDISPFYRRKLASLAGWKRMLVALLPLHVLYVLRTELCLLRVRLTGWTAPQRYRHARDLRVNIGCGSRGHPDWVNVDFMALPSVNCVYDCRKRLPFPDGSVRMIFTEHFFEHIDYTEETPCFLSECRRVLKAGGVLRIVVPDAGRYLRAYAADGWEALTHLRGLRADQFDPYTGSIYRTKMELINEVFRQAYTHKFAYDAETLRQVLHDAGFARTIHQDFGRSELPELTIDLPARAHESLYVEGIK